MRHSLVVLSCFFFPMMARWWGYQQWWGLSGQATMDQLEDGEGRTHRRIWTHHRGTLWDIKKKRIPQTADGKSLWFRLIRFCDRTICSRDINHLCAEAPAFHNVLNKGAKTDTTVHFRLCKSQCVRYIYIFASTPPSIFCLHTFFTHANLW